MFENDSFITIVFRFLNFGLVVGALVYIFKRYIYDVLENKITVELNYQKGLEEQEAALESKRTETYQAKKQQEQACKKLKLIVHAWNDALERQQHKDAQIKEAIREKMVARMQRQAAYMSNQRYTQAVMSKALDAAESELKKQFQDSKNNHSYIASLMSKLGESQS